MLFFLRVCNLPARASSKSFFFKLVYFNGLFIRIGKQRYNRIGWRDGSWISIGPRDGIRTRVRREAIGADTTLFNILNLELSNYFNS